MTFWVLFFFLLPFLWTCTCTWVKSNIWWYGFERVKSVFLLEERCSQGASFETQLEQQTSAAAPSDRQWRGVYWLGNFDDVSGNPWKSGDDSFSRSVMSCHSKSGWTIQKTQVAANLNASSSSSSSWYWTGPVYRRNVVQHLRVVAGDIGSIKRIKRGVGAPLKLRVKTIYMLVSRHLQFSIVDLLINLNLPHNKKVHVLFCFVLFFSFPTI
jgi:hypothetical protein